MLLGSRSGPVCDARGNKNDRRMPESEVETHRHRSSSVLHELASNVVDRSNVVSIDSVPKAEGVRQEGRSEQNRLFAESENCPHPGAQVSCG